MFAAAQAAGDLDGIEFAAGYVRAVAERIAKEQEVKAKKAETDARLRAAVADTDAGRTEAAAGRGGKGGKGGRVSWKKAAADLSDKSAAIKKALEAQDRELKVQLLAAQAQVLNQAQALAPRPPAPLPPAALPPMPHPL